MTSLIYEPGAMYKAYICSKGPRLLGTTKKTTAGQIISGILNILYGVLFVASIFIVG